MIDVENLKRVYVPEDGEGAFIEIGDYPDAPDHVEVRALGERNKAWWGEFRYAMSAEYAIALGKALIEIGEAKIKTKGS